MPRSDLVLLSALLFLVSPAALGAEVVQSALDGEALVAVGEDLHTLSAGGEAASDGLPAGLRLRRVRPLRSGWVATGRSQGAAGEELVVLRRRAGALERLPAPSAPETAYQSWGVPLVADGRLIGLAWLEGDEQSAMSVRVARWSDGEWREHETVATPTDGTQTALDGAVLTDGSWLLVWSAFDGTDDEIQWSLLAHDGWTTPAVLHAANDVPDIVPAVVASGSGALAAWSRFDGADYRLRLAHFSGAVWSERNWTADPGSLFPLFLTVGAETTLLFRAEVPERWWLAELDPDGGLGRTASLASERLDRPLVRLSATGVLFAWPRRGGDAERADGAPIERESVDVPWDPQP